MNNEWKVLLNHMLDVSKLSSAALEKRADVGFDSRLKKISRTFKITPFSVSLSPPTRVSFNQEDMNIVLDSR